MPPEPKLPLVQICARATGLTSNEVGTIARIGPKRYKVYQIPKKSGGMRTICHPSRELKALQHVFLHEILVDLPVHHAATAYKSGSSIKENTSRHLASRVILKLDFENFFPSIKIIDWKKYVKEMFPDWTTRDIIFSANVMFWGAGGYEPVCLSIGAPTSPLLSNALMFQFDSMIAAYADAHDLIYTRYADDITISAKGYLDKDAIMAEIRSAIDLIEFPRLKLNAAKTRMVSKATSRRVTGLVIANNGTLSLGRDRKRLISAMVHHAINGKSDADAIAYLAGLLSFANDVEPTFVSTLRHKYGDVRIAALQLGRLADSQ